MRQFERPELHSECDVAALVYGPQDDPDAILEAFVTDLRRQGFDAVGLLQRRKAVPGDVIDFFLIPRGDEEMGLGETGVAAGTPCGSRLQDLGEQVAHVLDRHPDIIVLNRFGWLEASGSGLLGLLADAIAHDVPVLTAVPEGLFERWLAVVQGLAIRLPCKRSSLEHWWIGLARGPHIRSAEPRFCERYK